MDITTTSLLANQLQTLDPKATLKENATKIVQESANIPLELSAQKSLATPSNAQEVIGHLLGSAVSEAKSKSAIYEILRNNQLFKNMGNFAEDVKSLTSLLKMDSSVAKPLALLQLFSKSIEQIDVKVLQEQVKNSGIFFESKLADSVTQKGVLETIQTLVSELQEHFATPSKATALRHEMTGLLNRLSDLQELSSKEAQTTLKNLLDVFRQGVKQEVQNAETPLFKEAYQTVQKLNYALKQMDLIASKVENYPASMKVEEHFTTQVKVLLELAKDNLGALQLEELSPTIDHLLAQKSLLKEVNSTPMPLAKETPPTPILNEKSMPAESNKSGTSQPVVVADETLQDVSKERVREVAMPHREALTEERSLLASKMDTTIHQMVTSVSKPPESVEEALKMVVNRLKQQIEILDVKSIKQADFIDKSSVLEQKIHHLIKPELFVGKAMAEKLSLNPADVELLSDMKGVLTKLTDTLSSAPQQNKEALEITNRLLTQVEYHQLFSYVSSSTHVYIPFSWDGLKGGSMMMKQSSDEKFHCHIDLDLEHYGKLNMMLLLSGEKYLDMSIAAQKKELSEKITQQLTKLKRALNEVGLITGNVKMLEYKEVNTVKNDYFSGEKLQFGINIKI